MGPLLLLFIVVPAVELALLIQIGSRIGTFNTLALIALTGVIGASLARYQGLQVLYQVRSEINEGRLPAGAMVDGIIILVAGALLVTPGVLTDAFGFLCLVPWFRGILKRELRRRFERAVSGSRIHVATYRDVVADAWPGPEGSDHEEPRAPFLEEPPDRRGER